MINKIYIIGPVGSGKSTLGQNLSKFLSFPYFELDNIIYNIPARTERKREDQLKTFDEIISKEKWIIEDVGRKRFYKGREKADLIILLEPSKKVRNKQIFKRWRLQVTNKIPSNYKQNIGTLLEIYKWSSDYDKKRIEYIKKLEIYKSKLLIMNTNNIEKVISEIKKLDKI